MCRYCSDPAVTHKVLARRGFLKFAVAAGGLAIAPRAFAAKATAPVKPENVLAPDAALDR
jgi:carbonic anhydrase